MLLIDVGVVAALCLWFRKVSTRFSTLSRSANTVFRAMGIAGLLFTCAAPLVARAQNPRTGLLTGILDADTQSHDFGDIDSKAAKLSCFFQLTNRGPIAAVIDRITTTCGCTTAKASQLSIPSGQSVTIPVAIDWTAKIGRCVEWVEIDVHAGTKHDVINLNVAGDVQVPLRASTRRLDFGVLSVGETVSKFLSLAADTKNSPMHLQRITLHNPAFQVKGVVVDGHAMQEPPWTGSLVEIEIACRPASESGELTDRIGLEFSASELNVNDLRLQAIVRPSSYVLPAESIITYNETVPLRIFAPSGVTSVAEVISATAQPRLQISEPSKLPIAPWWELNVAAKRDPSVEHLSKHQLRIVLGGGSVINCEVTVLN